jgi:hypothetical protein
MWKRLRIRFSLRTLILVATIVSVPLTWLSIRLHDARQQLGAVKRLTELRGHVEYDFLPQAGGNGTPRGWPIFRRWLGPHFFDRVDLVSLSPVASSGYGVLQVLPCNDHDLALVAQLRGLRRLGISNTKVTDDAMIYVGQIQSLEVLYLHGTVITDRGLQHLSQLTNLKEVSLHGTRMTDEGIAVVCGWKQLKKATLGNPGVTVAGWRRLKAALPNCDITYWEQGRGNRVRDD